MNVNIFSSDKLEQEVYKIYKEKKINDWVLFRSWTGLFLF